jgi:predicted P-loop ATPase
VKVDKINVPGIAAARDQLFAEALELYKSGTPIHVDNDALHVEAVTHQKMREDQDDWTEVIINELNKRRLDVSTQMTACDIYTKLLNGKLENYDQKINRRVSKIMTRIGIGKPGEPSRINGIVGRYYDLAPLLFESAEDRESAEKVDGTWE